MKKLLALLLLLAPAAGAQSSSTSTFVYAAGRRWLTLDPANAIDVISHTLAGNVYESLITIKSVNEPDVLEPFLATAVPSVENGLLSKDGLTYAFPIRAGVRFHDGSLMTPEDVRWSILRFMLLDTEGGPAALLLKPILGVYATRDASGKRVVDFKDAATAVAVKDGAVVIALKKPDNSFLRLMASLPLVASKSWAAAHGDWDGTEKGWAAFNGLARHKSYLHDHVNGTGPFRLESESRDEAVLARHDAYWRGPAALERVTYKVAADGGLRLFMLQAGDADAAFLDGTYRPYAAAVKNLRMLPAQANDQGEMLFFGFKVAAGDDDLLGSGKLDGRGMPPDLFADADVRRGFAWAFDYEHYFRTALGKKGRRVTAPFPESLVPGAAPEAAYAHDPRKAEEALRRALGGRVWEAGFIAPVAYRPNVLSSRLAAEALKRGVEALNPRFKIRLYPLSGGEFFAGIESGRLPLFINGYYGAYPDAHTYAFGLLHSQGYFPKHQGFADPALDALIEKALVEPDPAERRALYQKIRGIYAADLPHLYTYAPEPLRVCGEWVKGCDSTDDVNNLNFNNFPYFYPYSKTTPK
jgi:peptide/nickel transport system substrate-binding protein